MSLTFFNKWTPAPTVDRLAAQSIKCMALISVLGVSRVTGQTPA